jgi:hypothetical protein
MHHELGAYRWPCVWWSRGIAVVLACAHRGLDHLTLRWDAFADLLGTAVLVMADLCHTSFVKTELCCVSFLSSRSAF